MRKNKIEGAIPNSGRKKVLNPKKVRLTVPEDKVQELKEFAKTLITYEKN